MKNCTRRILPFFLAFVVLASALSVSLTVMAEPDITLELNGGAISGASATVAKGDLLPNYEKVTKNGATFGGWYANATFSGAQVFRVPDDAAAGTTYYARWIKHTENFENFDAYTDTADMMNNAVHWDDWKWPATGCETTLNTDAAHAYSGKSMKIAPNEADKKTNVINYNTAFPITGDGIALWVETTGNTSFNLRFNRVSGDGEVKVRNLPAGKFLLTIPWSEISSYVSGRTEFGETQILAIVSSATDVVYVDSIGTYTDSQQASISFNTNGGTWVDYTPPAQFTSGMALPTLENIKKDGLVFAGWYDNLGFIGNPVYTVPGNITESVVYYARWVKADVNYADFENHTDTGVVTSIDEQNDGNTTNDATNGFINEETGAGGFYFWGGVVGSTVQLNTDSAHAHSGSKSAKLVLKVKQPTTLYNTTQFGSDRVYFPTDTDLGEGIGFWINTDKAITVNVQLNYAVQSPKLQIPAGTHYVTVPWADLGNQTAPWITLICLTNPAEECTVYIDDIGTYSVVTDNKVTFHLNGGDCVGSYRLPVGYNLSGGLVLPDCDQIKQDGLAFAGWYDNEGLTGSPVYSIPAGTSGDKEYWAKWIIHDVNFDSFDSYDTDEDMLNDNHWSDWKWPAQNAQTTLNIDPAHVHNGSRSMKVCLNVANKNDEIVVTRVTYPQTGDGIAFWMETTNGATVKVRFKGGNSTYESAVHTVAAGKQIVMIPWSEIQGAPGGTEFWQTSLQISTPNADDLVYIDEIGTYREEVSKAATITYYTLSGSWADGYTAPVKYSAAGVVLPDYTQIVKYGYAFAGWYLNKDYSGDAVTVTPASGDIKLYAKWVKHTTGFDDFESYSGSVDWDAWSDSTVLSLSTNAANAHSGEKSMKIGVANKEAHNENYATACKNKAFSKAGDGLAFWIKSEIATEVRVAFNDPNNTYAVNVPAGRSYVTVPWSDFTALPAGDAWNPMFIRIPTRANNVANTVYIDDIGTYTNSVDRVITYNLNDGSFVVGAAIAFELDPESVTVLPTDQQVKKEGFFFAGWYNNPELTGVPVFCLNPDESKNMEYWAKWVEQVNINHNFEDFADSKALEDAEWKEATPYEGWRESGSVLIYLETNTANLAPESTKGLRAEYEVLDGGYVQSGSKPSAEFHNFSWSTTVGRRATDREGDGLRFWIKSDRTITMRVNYHVNGDPKQATPSQNLIIPATNDGITVYLPWSYIESDGKTLASFGFIIYDSIGTKGTVWLDDLGIYYNEKLVTYVAESEDKEIRITGYNSHITKDTVAQIKKYPVSRLTELGGQLPAGADMAYLAEYKLLNAEGGTTTLYGAAWVSFKLPKGADASKVGVYEVFFDGSLDVLNFTFEGDWITVYSLNPNGMILVTLNDTTWTPKGITIDENVIQPLVETRTITEPGDEDEEPEKPDDDDPDASDVDEPETSDVDNPDTSDVDEPETSDDDDPDSKTETPTKPTKAAGGKTESDGVAPWVIILICVGAAVVAAAVIALIAVKQKHSKKDGGAK